MKMQKEINECKKKNGLKNHVDDTCRELGRRAER